MNTVATSRWHARRDPFFDTHQLRLRSLDRKWRSLAFVWLIGNKGFLSSRLRFASCLLPTNRLPKSCLPIDWYVGLWSESTTTAAFLGTTRNRAFITERTALEDSDGRRPCSASCRVRRCRWSAVIRPFLRSGATAEFTTKKVFRSIRTGTVSGWKRFDSNDSNS